MDFDPAAFGLPATFGAPLKQVKPKQAAFHDKTKRVANGTVNGQNGQKDDDVKAVGGVSSILWSSG